MIQSERRMIVEPSVFSLRSANVFGQPLNLSYGPARVRS